MAQRPISSKMLVARVSRTTGAKVFGQKVGHEGISDPGNHTARRPIWAKVGCKRSWTTSKYGTKANIARHRGPPVIVGKGRNHRSSWAKVGTTGHMGKRLGPPVIWAKGQNHRSSWANHRSYGQKVGTTGHHGQRVGRARDCWTTSCGTKANLGKR